MTHWKKSLIMGTVEGQKEERALEDEMAGQDEMVGQHDRSKASIP